MTNLSNLDSTPSIKHGNLSYEWQTNCPKDSAMPFLTGVLRGGLNGPGVNTPFPGGKYYENSIVGPAVGQNNRGYVGIYTLKI